MDGRPVGRGEHRDIEVGANGFPREFDQHLLGAAVGSELDFAVSYPADYGSTELAGKTVHFHVHVRALSHKEVPPLDDEFAKDHGECSTLEELRQRARTRLEAEAAQHADDAMRQALLDALASANDIPIPNALVERRTEALMEEVWREWQQRRIRPKNETEALARLREELQPRARQQVKIGLLLEAIARQEASLSAKRTSTSASQRWRRMPVRRRSVCAPSIRTRTHVASCAIACCRRGPSMRSRVWRTITTRERASERCCRG